MSAKPDVDGTYHDSIHRDLGGNRPAKAHRVSSVTADREAFEKCCTTVGFGTARDADGKYFSIFTEQARKVWQAATLREREACAEDRMDAERYRFFKETVNAVHFCQYMDYHPQEASLWGKDAIDAAIDAAIRARSET